MGMTMTQKILASHAGLDAVTAGQLINAKLDIVLGNDITTPVAIKEFEKAGFNQVFDKDKVAIVLDHFVPNKDIKAAQQSKECREFACAHCVSHFYDVGKMGIEHALLPEQGVVTAGDCIIGADSHTCTYGALGAFSTGVGSTDMAAGMATGMAWFKVPSAIKLNLSGTLPENCSGKDVILSIIGKIGVDGALYKSMEFVGEGVKNLSMDSRLCICNMAVEAGAKNGIFPVDEITMEYMKNRCERTPVIFEADSDAVYDEVIEINLSE
ncbi:MAG: 3-isopropylmalate dehydratase large subunit, partial [Clostridia bacterium]|nr:3-isopropylmalate dehydratase large subunit [Clostridia bacterium]